MALSLSFVRVLGPLETEIMQILWQDERSTVKKVHRKLSQQRDIAYTTVMTTMGRLAEKGVLKRERAGKAYIYSPALSKHAFMLLAVRHVLAGLLDESDATDVEAVGQLLAACQPCERSMHSGSSLLPLV